MITRTGKTIYRTGTGGRSSKCNHVATVFGATGFLGPYIVQKLAKQGINVVIPWRDEMARRHLKLTGDLGTVTMLEFEPRNIESIESAVRNSTMVYNLIGRDFETKNFSFSDTHITIAGRIAEACAKYNVDRFVHLSALGANSDSPSAFLQSKAAGERIVREIIPDATIVRPSTVMGLEDRFLQYLANNPTLVFELNNGLTKKMPIGSTDVANALETMIWDDSTAGKTYELFGSQTVTVKEVRKMIEQVTLRTPRILNIPKSIAMFYAYFLDKFLYWNVTSPDQVERRYIDDVPSGEPGVYTFADLGITPQPLDDIAAVKYLRMYRDKVIMDREAESRKGFEKAPNVIDL